MSEVDDGGRYACVSVGACEKSLNLLLNFFREPEAALKK